METLLLTGGSGFIGRSILASPLAKEYTILAPTHKELDLLDADAVMEYMLKHQPDKIVHAATLGDVPLAIEANTRMYLNLVKCHPLFGRMFHLSSGAVYDRSQWLRGVRETELGRNIPTDPYGYSKYLICHIANMVDTVTDLYLFGVYGHGEAPERFPSRALRMALKGGTPLIYRDRKMSFMWVEDFIKNLRSLLKIPLPYKLSWATESAEPVEDSVAL